MDYFPSKVFAQDCKILSSISLKSPLLQHFQDMGNGNGVYPEIRASVSEQFVRILLRQFNGPSLELLIENGAFLIGAKHKIAQSY